MDFSLRPLLLLGGALCATFMASALAGQTSPPPVDGPSAGPPVRHSWVSDQRSVSVGQMVTILIDEQTLASADRERTSVRDRSRDVGVAVNGSGGGLRTDNDVTDRQRGESSRRERFMAEITARVVEIGPGDAFRIEGVKRVQIDDHEQAVTVRGWIRSSDLSPRNTVESWRIANAEILYDSNDELGKAGGFWSRLLDLIIP
ncbi:MAG: hypothetical protein HKO53_16235 [Gemmatimonadetes bacterium]|nr:hypothetical protein [Gemmatimonadota bacterium]